MRNAALGLFLLIPSLLPAQIVIIDADETTATPTPRPMPREWATPRPTVPPEARGIFIEPATGPTTPTLSSDEPITITPAPGARRQRPRQVTPTPALEEATPAARTPTPTPVPMVTPAPVGTQAVNAPEPRATAEPGPSFLPVVETGGTSPTTQRGGVTLPLRPEMIQAKPLDLTVPDVSETTLSNGMVLYHYRSSELPRISFSLLINAGKNFDPADKVGLADLTARTLRSGGAGSLSGDEFDRALEQIGSDLEVSADREYISVSLFALKENAGKALGLLADLLKSPTLDATKLEQQRGRMLEELRRQNDDPSEIGRREFRKLIYGADNPLGRTPTSATLQAITREDVVNFYEKFFRPSSVRIGVAGDVTLEEAKQLVEQALGNWNKPPAELPPPVTVDEARDSTAGVYLIPKATAQSQIRIGHLGIPRQSPEQYAINVLNNVYGTGGFSSRLMNTVRTKHGYAYGTGGALQSDTPVGLFFAGAGSKAQTTVAAIKAILQVTKDLLQSPISADEIETAKRDMIFSFFTGFDTPGEIVWSHMYYDFLGYPEDYLKTFPERIRAVSEQEMVEAAKKYIHPERLKILVVGEPSGFDAPLSELGPVQEIELEHVEPDMGTPQP